MTDPRTSTCPNCSSIVEGESAGRFCGTCGQDNGRLRLEARGVLLDVLQNFVGWNSALVNTMRGLLTAPGQMVVEYVEGKRRRYVNPAKFCLLSSALWYLAMNLGGLDALSASGIRMTATLASEEDKALTAALSAFIGRNLELLQYLSLPLLATYLRFTFRRAGRNFAECLVFVLYLFGLRYLASIPAIPFGAVWPDAPASFRVLFGTIWMTWAASRFFGTTLWGSLWRVMISFVLHLLSTLVLFGLVAIPWFLLRDS